MSTCWVKLCKLVRCAELNDQFGCIRKTEPEYAQVRLAQNKMVRVRYSNISPLQLPIHKAEDMWNAIATLLTLVSVDEFLQRYEARDLPLHLVASSQLTVSPSPLHGKGVFACAPIPVNTLITLYPCDDYGPGKLRFPGYIMEASKTLSISGDPKKRKIPSTWDTCATTQMQEG